MKSIETRYPLELIVTLTSDKTASTKYRVSGSVANLSRTGLGLCLKRKIPFALGETLSITLQLENQDESSRKVTFKARMVWSKNSTCGVEILDMPEKARAFYDTLIMGYKTLQEFNPNGDDEDITRLWATPPAA